MLVVSLIYFVAILSIAILFGGKKNVKIYAVKLTGILLLEFSLMEYVVKLSNYHTFMQIDYDIYLKMLNMRIMIYSISSVSNWSIVLIILAGMFFSDKIKKQRLPQYILIGICSALFIIINSNFFAQEMKKIFLYSWSEYEKYVIMSVRTVSCILVVAGLLYPYINVINEYARAILISRKKEMLGEITVWFLIDVSLIMLIFGSNLSNYLFYNLDMEKFPYNIVYISNNFMMALCAAVIVVLIMMILVFYAPFGIVGAEKRKKKILQEVNENVIMLLHTYKNAFCAIEMYANEKYDFLGEISDRINIIAEIANEQIDGIGQTIDMFRFKSMGETEEKYISIDDCIKKCLKSMALDSAISVKLDLNLGKDKVLIDEHQLVEVLRCVTGNSVEALADTKNPCIEFTTGRDGIYDYVCVRDNGCGIAQDKIDRVFDPLFSTKKGVKNFGFGLTFVKKVIEESGGTVEIISDGNEYTLVQIAIPAREEKRYG